MRGRDVVGIDLIAAENELVRAFQRVLEELAVRDEIVDPRHRVWMLVGGTPARAVDETQMLERVGW
jgi:hypothetical protein